MEKIIQFVQMVCDGNKYFDSNAYQKLKDDDKAREISFQWKRKLESQQNKVLEDLEMEIDRLKQIKQIVSRWEFHNSELIDLRITEGLLSYKRFCMEKPWVVRLEGGM